MYRRDAATSLGWVLFILAVAGLLATLGLLQPIVANLTAFCICCAVCLLAAFIGWGFSHYSPAMVWRSYFTVLLKSLLISTCVAAVLCVSYLLMRRSQVLPLEASIGVFIVAMALLLTLRWTHRHPIFAAVLAFAFASGVGLQLSDRFNSIVVRVAENLNIYGSLLALEAIVNPMVLLNGLLLLAFVVWVVFAIRSR
jgi:uncharacterized MnhB-related membrane protein